MASLEERFWEKVDRRSDAECWPWTATTDGRYGKIRDGGAMRRAHRVCYELVNGDPGDESVVHTCANKLCVNPNHLSLGTVPVSERFWGRVDSGGEAECWEWQAGTDPDGYGVIRDGGVQRKAHRVAYEIRNGDLGGGWVLHHCDNPSCVNPTHLYLGDHEDNTRDAVDRGRYPSGGSHPRSKLNRGDVSEIKDSLGGVSQYDLAEEYGVSRSCIARIAQRETWESV